MNCLVPGAYIYLENKRFWTHMKPGKGLISNNGNVTFLSVPGELKKSALYATKWERNLLLLQW